ncbi:thiol-disulfide oxidoreductase DCC family protein [Paenibacillus sp. NPDC058071]|uniref:thiol-disulfide oxidoreductase DCC family protein n=1 Tax=Paenibacillus sp. NPDC058071 TaxID=3346326 RepID=UPI0036DECBB2
MSGSSKETLYVIYDGHCRLCIATVTKLQAWPSKAELLFLTIQALEESSAAWPPTGKAMPSSSELYERIHVLDAEGLLFGGADGVVRIMRTLPGMGPIAALYRVPGMNRLADRMYRFIAARRYEWFGRTESGCAANGCSLPKTTGEGER